MANQQEPSKPAPQYAKPARNHLTIV